METKNGFFQSVSGDLSSARLVGCFCLVVAVIFSGIMIYKSASVTEAATAIGIVFTTIGTPAMVYLLQNKKVEINHEESKQEIFLNNQSNEKIN